MNEELKRLNSETYIITEAVGTRHLDQGCLLATKLQPSQDVDTLAKTLPCPSRQVVDHPHHSQPPEFA